MDSSIGTMKCPSMSLLMAFVLQPILCVINIAILAFIPCPSAWTIFFQPFTFSPRRSFVLKWDSCRQHMCESWFLIPSATLCLFFFFGAFTPLTFKVIIHRFLFTFPPLYLCSFLSLTLLLPLLIAVPLAYLAMLVWWRYSLSDFFCLGNSFHLPF